MLAAHDGAASALDVNPHIRGCLITGGTDKLVKVWNVTDKADGKKDVSLAISRDLGLVSDLFPYRIFSPSLILLLPYFHTFVLHSLSNFLLLSYSPISSFLGQSLLGYVLPRRPLNHRSSRLKSQTPNLGRRSKRGCPKNLLSKAQRSRTRSPREARRWYRWCCERR